MGRCGRPCMFWAALAVLALALAISAEAVAPSAGGAGVAAPAEEGGAAREAPGADGSKPQEDGGDGLKVEALASLAGTLLPGQIATVVIGALMVLRSVHDNVSRCFQSFPGQSCTALVALLGIFCWTTLSMFWRLEAPGLEQLGAWTALSGLFATSMLLLTPIFLLVPEQSRAEARAVVIYGQEVVGASKQLFKDLNRCMARLYLVLAVFQLLAAASIFRIAEMEERQLREAADDLRSAAHSLPSALGGFLPQAAEARPEGAPSPTGPLLITALYLILAWCNLTVVYERLLGRSFPADFPTEIMHLAFPYCVTKKQELVAFMHTDFFSDFNTRIVSSLKTIQRINDNVASLPRFLDLCVGECTEALDLSQLESLVSFVPFTMAGCLEMELYEFAEKYAKEYKGEAPSFSDVWEGKAEFCGPNNSTYGAGQRFQKAIGQRLEELCESKLRSVDQRILQLPAAGELKVVGLEDLQPHIERLTESVKSLLQGTRKMIAEVAVEISSMLSEPAAAVVLSEEAWKAFCSQFLISDGYPRAFCSQALIIDCYSSSDRKVLQDEITRSLSLVPLATSMQTELKKRTNSLKVQMREKPGTLGPELDAVNKAADIMKASVAELQAAAAAPEVLRATFMEQSARVLAAVDPLLSNLPEPVFFVHLWAYKLAGIAGVVVLGHLSACQVWLAWVQGHGGPAWAIGSAMAAILAFSAVFLFWAATGQLHDKLPTAKAGMVLPSNDGGYQPLPPINYATPPMQTSDARGATYAAPALGGVPPINYATPPMQTSDARGATYAAPALGGVQTSDATPPMTFASPDDFYVAGATAAPGGVQTSDATPPQTFSPFWHALAGLVLVSWALTVLLLCLRYRHRGSR